MRSRDYCMEVKTDVVPIINVSLVIVLTLMIISPFLNNSDLEVKLPEATTTETEDQDKVEIVMTADGRFSVQDEEIDLASLPAALADEFVNAPSRIAVLKADKGIAYGEVERVIAVIQKSGAPRIALATEQKTGGDG